MSDWQILQGDALGVLPEVPPSSVDAVVTDPPYGLKFMGKAWDRGIPGVPFWAETLRALKPGAYLLAFGGTRTYHRLACAVEDAGFEIRDCVFWLYGSGFPKSLDVSKAIDRAAGERTKSVGDRPMNNIRGGDYAARSGKGGMSPVPFYSAEPVTRAALEWEGWGTALKPACEPIVLARKPLAGTVAANVLEHGTGALNVDGCRIGTTKNVPASRPKRGGQFPTGGWRGNLKAATGHDPNIGRWPANVALDEEAAAMLDAQAGDAGAFAPVRGTEPTKDGFSGGVYGAAKGRAAAPFCGDNGGPSRFFYTAKASSGERHYAGKNTHPTVKPVELMRWLVRLVTPPGGLVLDPFMGSGSTGVAALAEGFRFVGIELSPEYVAMARRRIAGPLFAEGAP